MKFFFSLLAFLVIYCDDSGNITPQEADKAAIDNLNVEIKSLADASVCSEEFTCYSVGIGSKPCGGFWEYIVYSDSIDVVSFLAKIETLNELEKAYNEKYGIISDCSVAMPPSSMDCVDGKCVGIFQ
jgi:hypothetical protein